MSVKMSRQEVYKELATLSERIFELSKQLSDFTDMLNEQRKSDIDYIAMMTDVDMDQDQGEDE